MWLDGGFLFAEDDFGKSSKVEKAKWLPIIEGSGN